ncbi:MAG: Nucleoid occlusion protein [Methanobacterium sp. PtaU1.Bin097]|nr:MAG: Nucleoid occlusion protein [Methanobacterium sp. PtaU1.Bin097]
MKVNLNQIYVPDTRIRRNMNSLESLKLSLQSAGMLEPVLVKATPENLSYPYELLAGYRRYKAASELGWAEIPVILHTPENTLQALDMAIHENMERINYSPLELSELVLQRKIAWETLHGKLENNTLSEEFYKETGRLLQKHPTDIHRFLQLTGLDEDLKNQVKSGELYYREALSQQSERNNLVKSKSSSSTRKMASVKTTAFNFPKPSPFMLDIGKLPEPHRSIVLKVISMQPQLEKMTTENQINPSFLGDNTLQILSELALNVSQYLAELASRFQEEMVKRTEAETENGEETPVDEAGSENDAVNPEPEDSVSDRDATLKNDNPLTAVKGPP